MTMNERKWVMKVFQLKVVIIANRPEKDNSKRMEEDLYPQRDHNTPSRWWSALCNDENGWYHKLKSSISSNNRRRTNSERSNVCNFGGEWIVNSRYWGRFQSLAEKDTWTSDDNPQTHPLTTYVLLEIKLNSDVSVERFTARVIGVGNFPAYGVEFFKTYAPVVAFIVVRIFLTIAFKIRIKKKVIDVKTAFLNDMLQIDIWVISHRGIPSRCQKLNKAIYGLMLTVTRKSIFYISKTTEKFLL